MKKEHNYIDETILLKIIENTADEREKSLFKNWHEASAKNVETYEQFKKTNQLISNQTHSRQRNWESLVQKVESGKEVPDYIELPSTKTYSIGLSNNRLVRIAAMIVFLIGMPFLLKTLVFDNKQLTISSNDLKPNEPYLMADGSMVYLNKNSEISFSKEFENKNRNITLKGEAFFEVKKDEHIPFIITTYNTKIQVLGTSFNVYSDKKEQVRVSVVSGIVEFYTENDIERIKLRAGELGIYNPNINTVTKETNDDPNFLAWKTGVLIFDKTPLTEVFLLLQKKYSKVFVLEERENDIENLTTSIENQKLEDVIEELNILLNTHNEIRNDTIIFKTNN